MVISQEETAMSLGEHTEEGPKRPVATTADGAASPEMYLRQLYPLTNGRGSGIARSAVAFPGGAS